MLHQRGEALALVLDQLFLRPPLSGLELSHHLRKLPTPTLVGDGQQHIAYDAVSHRVGGDHAWASARTLWRMVRYAGISSRFGVRVRAMKTLCQVSRLSRFHITSVTPVAPSRAD